MSSSSQLRHCIMTPRLLRQFHNRPPMDEMEPRPRHEIKTLNQCDFPSGEPRTTGIYRVRDLQPFLWTICYHSTLLFDVEDFNSFLYFVHQPDKVCDFSEWGEDDSGKETTQPMVHPDENGVFHCNKCGYRMGRITDLVIAKDMAYGRSTFVYNKRELDYFDAVEPIIELETEEDDHIYRHASVQTKMEEEDQVGTDSESAVLEALAKITIQKGETRSLKQSLMAELQLLAKRAGVNE